MHSQMRCWKNASTPPENKHHAQIQHAGDPSRPVIIQQSSIQHDQEGWNKKESNTHDRCLYAKKQEGSCSQGKDVQIQKVKVMLLTDFMLLSCAIAYSAYIIWTHHRR